MDVKNTPVNELRFNQAVEELNTIVINLEQNNLELEDSLLAYERGVQLLNHLNANLRQAKLKISSLIEQPELNTNLPGLTQMDN